MSRKTNLILLTLLLSALTACGGPAPNDTRPQDDNGTGEQPGESMVVASGWNELKSKSWGTTVTISKMGHFDSSWTPCLKSASGALENRDWQVIATHVNAILLTPPLSDDKKYCIPFTPEKWGFDDNLEVLQANGKRTLLDYRGGEVCTTIASRQQAQELLGAINNVMIQAAHEDCPNAHP
jgi:hypothetical protein